ncbi:ATP-binding cassette domain-containing protein [candidate division KSB1 bacterium]|nr:ATP-binding cassette domain-containing protein [candidate division KSB1 bacterium]
MIQLENLHKSYGKGGGHLHVLKGIDLHICKGEFTSIMGVSGSGKSTLLNILGLLDDYDRGNYFLEEKLIKNLTQVESAMIRNKKIGFVFQFFNLIEYKNALDNVALPLLYSGVHHRKSHMIAMEYLEKFGLQDWAKHYPNELSGGQKQRIAIARAMVTNPSLILADEPTGAIDSMTSNQVIRILEEINKEGVTVLIVTHEKDIAKRTHRIIKIKDGIIRS